MELYVLLICSFISSGVSDSFVKIKNIYLYHSLFTTVLPSFGLDFCLVRFRDTSPSLVKIQSVQGEKM